MECYCHVSRKREQGKFGNLVFYELPSVNHIYLVVPLLIFFILTRQEPCIPFHNVEDPHTYFQVNKIYFSK